MALPASVAVMFAGVLGLAAAPPGANTADPDYLTFTEVSALGTGCPTKESYDWSIQDKGRAFSVGFFAYAVRTPAPDDADARQDAQCNVKIKIRQRPGWTYVTTTVIFEGNALREDAGATARLTGNYQYTGGTGSRPTKYDLVAKPDGNIQDFLVEQRNENDANYVPCGSERFLNVNTVLEVTGGPRAARATATMVANHGRAVTIKFREKPCA